MTQVTANMVINANINITKQSARTKIVQTKHVPSDTQNPVSTKNVVDAKESCAYDHENHVYQDSLNAKI